MHNGLKIAFFFLLWEDTGRFIVYKVFLWQVQSKVDIRREEVKIKKDGKCK